MESFLAQGEEIILLNNYSSKLNVVNVETNWFFYEQKCYINHYYLTLAWVVIG